MFSIITEECVQHYHAFILINASCHFFISFSPVKREEVFYGT